MEQHGNELNDKNKGEEEYEHKTDGFQLKIFFTDVHLKEKTALHPFKTHNFKHVILLK